MGARAPIPIPLASVKGLSGLASNDRVVNCYPEKTGAGPNERIVLYGRAGLTQFANDLTDVCRGGLVMDDRLLTVNGTTLYSLDTAGIVTTIGTIPGYDKVVMARNSNPATQAVIVCDAGVFTYQSGTVGPFADPDLPAGVVGVVWVDGYFIFALANGKFYISGINAVTVDALDFATAEANPDGLVAVARLRREVYFLGTATTEVWTNSGAAAFPFERLPGAVIQSGCASQHTVRELNGALYWLDTENNVVRTTGGYTVEPISDRGVYESVRSISNKEDIRAFAYVLGQHSFYVLTCLSWTWMYDAMTGLWSEATSKGSPCWRACTAEIWAGKIVCGDQTDGSVWYIDENSYAEGGDEIEFIARFPRIDSFPNGGIVDQLDLDIETGVGTDVPGSATDTIDPKLTLRWSDDGAKTWKGGRIYEIGKKGEYRKRVRATRLGSFRDKGRVWEVSITSRVFKALLGASMTAEEIEI